MRPLPLPPSRRSLLLSGIGIALALIALVLQWCDVNSQYNFYFSVVGIILVGTAPLIARYDRRESTPQA